MFSRPEILSRGKKTKVLSVKILAAFSAKSIQLDVFCTYACDPCETSDTSNHQGTRARMLSLRGYGPETFKSVDDRLLTHLPPTARPRIVLPPCVAAGRLVRGKGVFHQVSPVVCSAQRGWKEGVAIEPS